MGCKYSKPSSSTRKENNHEPLTHRLSCKESLDFLVPQAKITRKNETVTTQFGVVDIFDILIYGRITQSLKGQLVAAGWPTSLAEHAPEALEKWLPRKKIDFQILHSIGKGAYSSVYKAIEVTVTGERVHKKYVALKRVVYNKKDPKGIKFMAREIVVLRRLDHENVIKLTGLLPSESEDEGAIYLVFEYMEHDLGLELLHDIKFKEPMIKCYMQQLLKGLEHCHTKGVLHRDLKGANLLVDNNGILKIADFGLASIYDRENKYPLTNRIAASWYRPPELLLSASHYGPGVDLWSCGCILGELFAGKPILQGKTEIEQLHKTFQLCGSPPANYWEKLDLPKSTKAFSPERTYSKCIAETFKDFPPSAIRLMETLLSIDPADRGTATSALQSEFFTTEPFACQPSSLPKFQPSKEMDAVELVDIGGRQAAVGGMVHGNGLEMIRVPKASPPPKIRACDSSSKSRVEMLNPPIEERYLGNLPKRTRAMREATRKASHSGPLVSARTNTYTVVVPGSYSTNHSPQYHMPRKAYHGECSMGNRISMSGPLYVPSNNQMLNDQEGNMHAQAKQVDFIDFYEM